MGASPGGNPRACLWYSKPYRSHEYSNNLGKDAQVNYKNGELRHSRNFRSFYIIQFVKFVASADATNGPDGSGRLRNPMLFLR
jgi:hypothetical protein